MNSKKVNTPFFVFSFSIMAILLFPQLFQEGLFMDGLIYSTLSHNLAEGFGTFWFPKFSETIMFEYFEHPPLVFGIQSLFFRLLGDSFFVEKIYSFITALLTALFIILIWKKITYKTEFKYMYWLPVILWITIPKAFWSYNNNMLENTMGLFSLAAIYFLFISIDISNITKRIACICLSAMLVLLGFLSKGFPALFPIVFFFLYFLVFRSKTGIRRTIIHSIIFVLALTGITILLIGWNDVAIESLGKYIKTQVFESLRGERVVVSRWFIMKVLFTELLAVLIISTLFIIFYYRTSIRKIKNETFSIRYFILFLLIGLSATAPIMISPKQLSFYIVPSLPYFAIGFSILIAHIIGNYINRIDIRSIWFKIFRISGFLLLLISILLSILNYGGYCRDEELIKDVVTIGNHIPEHSTINNSKTICKSWLTMGYIQRKYFINLDCAGNLEHDFFLIEIQEPLPEGYSKQELNLTKYQVLRKDAIISD